MSMGPTENKRRYPRQSVRQDAQLQIAGGTTLPCEIRDFCLGGLFVKSTLGEAGYDNAQPGASVNVLFTPTAGPPGFELHGRIAHVSGNGMGVAFFENPPISAIVALQERAASLKRGPPAGRSAQGATVDLNGLGRICRQALESLLSPVLEDFFGEVDAALLRQADKTRRADQAVYFEARASLKCHRRDIESGFCKHVLRQAEHFVALSDDVPESPGIGSELSLVDPAEFEDWLNLSEEIAKIEDSHEQDLQRIERRFSWLADREVNRTNNPYAPGVIEHSFRDALRDLPLHNDAKHLIYEVFGHVLDPRLSDLYHRIDEVTRHIVPPDAVLARGTDKAGTRLSPAVSEPPRTSSTPPPASTTRPTPYAAAGTLLSLCSHVDDSGRKDHEAGAGVTLRDPAAIISALRRLQARKSARHVDYLDTPTLEAELAGLLFPPGQIANTLADDQRQTIEILGSLLDNVVTQGWIPSGVKSYLQTLQIPLLEAALADPNLIHGESHPARDVVNLLDHLALATNARGEIENEHLRQAVAAISERVVRDAVDNPSVFGEAKAQLEMLMAPLLKARAARIARLQESCEAEQRVELARRTVEAAIDARIMGKSVPTLVVQLLEVGWRQLLTLTILREGIGTARWNDRIAVLDHLLEWLAPECAKPVPALEAHRLIALIDEQLQTVCPELLPLNRMVLDLTAALIGRSDTGERKPVEFTFVQAPPQLREAEEAQAVAKDRLRAFSVGDWLDFKLASGACTPLRLSWIGECPDRYVFADYKGRKGLDLTAEQFVRYLDEHRANIADDKELPLLERATSRLVQNMQDKLRFQATHDAVTGLVNRKEFVRQIQARISAAGPAFHLMCTLDLSQLRVINNLCGTEAGDRLLGEIGAILRARFPRAQLVGRLGDSSFGVLFGADSQGQTREQAQMLLREIANRHFKWGEHSFTLAANLGMATLAGDGADPEALLRNADAACMAAKQKGPNCMQVYTVDDASLAAQKQMLDWAGRIDSLFAENRLFVRCQMIAPIFPERDAYAHYEILLGIRDEQGAAVSPFEFVMAAERWNRISEIDRWQVKTVFRWIREHRASFDPIGGFSINLSGQSLNSEGFLEFLHAELAQNGLPTEKITFEITETSAISEFGYAGRFIRQIKRHGCRFSLDDFGSGFSSYAYLKNLRADYLKIDGSFVRDLASSGTDYALVKSMNEIGHSLGMKTIAEYVESEAIIDKLKEIGVDYAQGYAIRKPSTITELILPEPPRN